MFLTHNRPFLNFDDQIDIDELFKIKPYISAFIARNHHLLKPTKFRGEHFKNGKYGIQDYQEEFKKTPSIVKDPALQQIVSDLVNCDQFGNYIIFEKDVISCTFSMVVRYSLDYLTKHHATQCVPLPEDTQFDFFYKWLDKQEIFSDYGRITLFINYPGAHSAVHTDYTDTSQPNLDEFIWINFNPDRKKFYLVDNDTGVKIYSPGVCSWFNTSNHHGSDPVDQACYSLRVDGLFSEAFKQRAFK